MAKPTTAEPLLRSPSPYYSPPPPPPPYLEPQPPVATTTAYLLIPVRLRRRCRCCCLLPLLSFSLLALAALLLWPSDPEIRVARLRLDHIAVVARPAVAVTISTALKVRVRNPDLFTLYYRHLDVAIGYRGRRLGTVAAAPGGGRARARGVSYVDAELRLDGIRIVADAFYLLEDLSRGSIPFDTVAEVDGRLRLSFLTIPVQGKISCLVNVNVLNHTIVGQDCYPE